MAVLVDPSALPKLDMTAPRAPNSSPPPPGAVGGNASAAAATTSTGDTIAQTVGDAARALAGPYATTLANRAFTTPNPLTGAAAFGGGMLASVGHPVLSLLGGLARGAAADISAVGQGLSGTSTAPATTPATAPATTPAITPVSQVKNPALGVVGAQQPATPQNMTPASTMTYSGGPYQGQSVIADVRSPQQKLAEATTAAATAHAQGGDAARAAAVNLSGGGGAGGGSFAGLPLFMLAPLMDAASKVNAAQANPIADLTKEANDNYMRTLAENQKMYGGNADQLRAAQLKASIQHHNDLVNSLLISKGLSTGQQQSAE